MIKITQADERRCDTLVKILNRTKFELDGAEEILAMGQVLHWVSDLQQRIKKDVAEMAEADKARVAAALAAMDAAKATEPPADTLAKPQADQPATKAKKR